MEIQVILNEDLIVMPCSMKTSREIQGARDMRFMKKLTQDFLLAQEQMCDVRGYWALLEHSFTQKTLGICQKTIMLLK